MATIVRMLSSMAGEDFSVSPGDLVRMTQRNADNFVRGEVAEALGDDEPFDESKVVNYFVTAHGPLEPETESNVDGAGKTLAENAGLSSNLQQTNNTDPNIGLPKSLSEITVLDLPMDPKVHARLMSGLNTIDEAHRPATIQDLVDYAAVHDPVALPGVSKATWKAVSVVIETLKNGLPESGTERS